MEFPTLHGAPNIIGDGNLACRYGNGDVGVGVCSVHVYNYTVMSLIPKCFAREALVYKVQIRGDDDNTAPLTPSYSSSCIKSPNLQSYLYRDGYVGAVLCYHHHLVCVPCRPVTSLHPSLISIT